jgi:uncharacterized protein (TIGR03435 family)
MKAPARRDSTSTTPPSEGSRRPSSTLAGCSSACVIPSRRSRRNVDCFGLGVATAKRTSGPTRNSGYTPRPEGSAGLRTHGREERSQVQRVQPRAAEGRRTCRTSTAIARPRWFSHSDTRHLRRQHYPKPCSGQWLRAKIERLVRDLDLEIGKPVVDAPDLKGTYDLSLYWVPDPMRPDAGGPTLFAALEEQLGLKLTSKKVTIPVVLVDHTEKVPTGN